LIVQSSQLCATTSFRILLGIDPAVSLPPQIQTLILWPAVGGLALLLFQATATQDIEVIRGALGSGALLSLVASNLVFQSTMKLGWMTNIIAWAATASLAVHVATSLSVGPPSRRHARSLPFSFSCLKRLLVC
jgi:hypothetical protein